MLTKKELKQFLLSTGYFIDNIYLKNYIDLVLTPIDKEGYTEKHHILQVSYYKNKFNCSSYLEASKLARQDANNTVVELLYKDHCKAHWLLYYCTTDFLKRDNMSAVEYIKKMYRKLTKKNRFKFNELDFNIIQDYMDNIRNSNSSKWYSDIQIEFLINNYKNLGATKCAELLDKSVGSIHSKAFELNLCSKRPLLWTADEDAVLYKYFPVEGGEVYKRFSNRSELSCRKRAFKLGIASLTFDWPTEALEYLKLNYSSLGPVEISKNLDSYFGVIKSVDACRGMATKYGLHFTKKADEYAKVKTKISYRLKWTQELDDILYQYYPVEGGLCANRILGASKQAVITRASKLKIKFERKKL